MGLTGAVTEGGIRVHGLTKRFRTRKGIPVHSTMGDGHWLQSIFIKATSPEERFTAVDHVDLEVPQGGFVGLLGPNGAGKTTLMKCLSTLLIPDEGTAVIDGHDLVTQADVVKRSITLIGSGAWVAFDWALTVRENLEFFGNLYGLERSLLKRRLAEALELVELTGQAGETPRTLSSGQRQRLVLAKGFVVRTPVFFLDEPTANLDPQGAREVLKYIRTELSGREGTTIILTTHHIQEAEELCDRVAIMDRGRVIAIDSPGNLKKIIGATQSIEVDAIGDLELAARRLRGAPGVKGVAVTQGGVDSAASSMRVGCEDLEAATAWVMEALQASAVTVQSVRPSGPTLEDVFIALTGRGLSNGTERRPA